MDADTSLVIYNVMSILTRSVIHKTDLHVNLQNVTVNISQLIESTLPEEYAERKQIHEEEMKKLAR